MNAAGSKKEYDTFKALSEIILRVLGDPQVSQPLGPGRITGPGNGNRLAYVKNLGEVTTLLVWDGEDDAGRCT
jgi:hypothetical protein